MSTCFKIIPALVVVVAMTGASANAYADPTARSTGSVRDEASHWNRGHHRSRGEFHRVLRQLKLSPEQHAQVHSIVAKAKPQLRELFRTSHETHRAYINAMPGDANYRNLVASEKANTTARIQASSDIKAQIFAILTPAQRAQIPGIVAADQAAHAARMAKWQEHRARS